MPKPIRGLIGSKDLLENLGKTFTGLTFGYAPGCDSSAYTKERPCCNKRKKFPFCIQPSHTSDLSMNWNKFWRNILISISVSFLHEIIIKPKLEFLGFTGKSFSEALILASWLTHNMTRDCSLNSLKNTRSQHVFCFDIQNTTCTQHVVNLYFSGNSMNNLL